MASTEGETQHVHKVAHVRLSAHKRLDSDTDQNLIGQKNGGEFVSSAVFAGHVI